MTFANSPRRTGAPAVRRRAAWRSHHRNARHRGARPGVMIFSARNAMVAALTAEAAAILEMAGARSTPCVEDGQALAPGGRDLPRAGPRRRVAARLESRPDPGRDLVGRRHRRARNRGRGARGRARHLRRLHAEKHARREKFRRRGGQGRRRRHAPAWPVGDDIASFPSIAPSCRRDRSKTSRRACAGPRRKRNW